MTSYEFEVIAKNAVIEVLIDYNIKATIKDLDFVWFAHEFGYKKCTIWGKPMGNLYAEVSFNCVQNELYVNIYAKDKNVKFTADEFDKAAHLTLGVR